MRIIRLILVFLGVGFLVLLFLSKGSMNEIISKKMTEQTGADTRRTVEKFLDSTFNYQKNGEAFRITFLEFGATGCISCRKMELVMKEITNNYHESVKVKFYNVLMAENQQLMHYFGVAAIPTQVLLDHTGKEFFRHTGYLSYNELVDQLGFKLK